jgi:hypothetical protein
MALVSEFQLTRLLQHGYIDFSCGSDGTAGVLCLNGHDLETSLIAPRVIGHPV